MGDNVSKIKVCHMTSAHNSDDIRIFHKECASLAKAGYDTYLVAKGESREEKGVHVVGVGPAPGSRLKRMALFSNKIYRRALAIDADIYHFHDPELLPYGLKLKKAGKKVIFDSHEDVSAQIKDKTWIPKLLRTFISRVYRVYEIKCVRRFDAVAAATPHIASTLETYAKKVSVINNYPLLDDIEFHTTPFVQREPIVCYAGGINQLRGEKVMVDAMKNTDGILILAGGDKKFTIGDFTK